MKDNPNMSYEYFCQRLKDYLMLCTVVEKVTCPYCIITVRDEVKAEIQEAFSDNEDNLTRWQKGEPCIFMGPRTHQPQEFVIGNDTETLYQFLTYCYEIKIMGTTNQERQAHLAYLLSRKQS